MYQPSDLLNNNLIDLSNSFIGVRRGKLRLGAANFCGDINRPYVGRGILDAPLLQIAKDDSCRAGVTARPGSRALQTH